MNDVTMLWHYTTGEKMIGILQEGMIKTTDIGIEQNEKPAAWFSTNQTWEESATKSLTDIKSGTIRTATIDEMMQYAGGLARIGVKSDLPGLVSWEEFKRKSGISKKTAKSLEKVGKQDGGKPSDWYAIFTPVPLWFWEQVEIFDGSKWIDLPHDLHMKVVGCAKFKQPNLVLIPCAPIV